MYIRKTWTYGNRKEIREYHTFKFQKAGEKRSKKKNVTPEEIAKANERAAIRYIIRLLINNFDAGDWHLVLTYAKENRPEAEQAKRILKNFHDRMRREYRKRGEELKWFTTTEYENTCIHHHLIINDIDGLSKILRKQWKYGGIHMTPLYENYDYEDLAKYFVKETKDSFKKNGNPFKQRWSRSRNLKLPKEEVEIVKANTWRKTIKPSKRMQEEGYKLDEQSVYVGVDKMGYPFREYIFKKDKWQQQRGGTTRAA